MKHVALATCVNLPEPDPDETLLLRALAQAGVGAELLPWDDPWRDASAYDLCVLRSTWNYPERPEAFEQWIERLNGATRLLNPISVLRWNLHKSYLRELEQRGVRIPPTAWPHRGEPASFAAIIDQTGWTDVVIKPCVSAASFQTRRFSADQAQEAQAFLEAISRRRDVMVQQYMAGFDDGGERALVWIDGAWTHAVRKSPRFADADERVSEALEITDEERAFAETALSALDEDLLYARADMIRDAEGSLYLSELELIEPSLFLAQCPEALERFVAGICRECASPSKKVSGPGWHGSTC